MCLTHLLSGFDGGAAAKRAREVTHDMCVRSDDSQVIISALTFVPPDGITAFLKALPPAEVDAFVEKVMMQKNADRVINALTQKIHLFNAIEAPTFK